MSIDMLTVGMTIYGALVAALIGTYSRLLAGGLRLMDHPSGGRKHHIVSTPLMGGLLVLFGILPAVPVLLLIGGVDARTGSVLLWLGTATSLVTIVGLVDDRGELGALRRLLICFLIFAAALYFEPAFALDNIRLAAGPGLLSLGAFGVFFTVFCLAGLLNAVNMADGKNGLVISMAIGWTLLLLPKAPPALFPLLAAFTAGLTVLLIFNLQGRLFLGDGGSYGLSALIGLTSVYTYKYSPTSFPADVLILLFCVPILDMFRLIWTRAAEGRSPFSADRDHLHHRLYMAFGWPAGLVPYLLLAIGPSVMGSFWPQAIPLLLLGTVIAFGAIVLVTGKSGAGNAEGRALRERG